MGASFTTDSPTVTLPITVCGKAGLEPVTWQSPVASAQVKSAILLAGLRGAGTTTVCEPVLSRNHTELLLEAYGVNVQVSPDGLTTSIQGGQQLQAANLNIPGDPSSAAFMLVAAALVPGSQICVEGTLLNPTRCGFINIMKRMGADITVREDRGWQLGQELVGSIELRYASGLTAVEVDASEVPALIDEIPILALLACAARGTTVFRQVGELRVKESDRLSAIIEGLSALGAKAWSQADDLYVAGGVVPSCGQSGTVSAISSCGQSDAVGQMASGAKAPGAQAPGARGAAAQGTATRGLGAQAPAAQGTAAQAPTEQAPGVQAPPAHGDHRLAMTWAIADVAFGLNLTHSEQDTVAVSYPNFFGDLQRLRQQ
jgi:5-enolpyruvylshikimate-3-phosphate synthase